MKSRTQQKVLKKAAFKAESQRRWEEWLNNRGAPLRSIGLPDEILADEDHWTDFCTHGRLHMYPSISKFSAASIPDAEGNKLLDFLDELLTAEEKPYSALYRILSKRVSS